MTAAELAAERHAPLGAILAGARSGDMAKALSLATEYHGTYDGEHRTMATRKGVEVDGQRVTWREVAAIVEPNLTPGLLAEGSSAYRLYVAVATDGVDATTDRLAYFAVHFPAYCRATEQMRRVQQALTAAPTVGQLELFGDVTPGGSGLPDNETRDR